MKKLLLFSFLFTLFLGLFFANPIDAYVNVRGYYRSNGTYVRPHVRSNPNGLKYDNYSWTPSQGLYNDTYGTRDSTWDTPTYITDPDYYTGQYLYEQGKTSLSTPSVSSYESLISSVLKTLPKKDVSYSTKNWVDLNPTTPCKQSTFLREKERIECEIYKSSKSDYEWNVTTSEFDGKHYIYNSKTEITSSCPDGYSIIKDDSVSNKLSCGIELLEGCTDSFGYSLTTGLSCSPVLPEGCEKRGTFNILDGSFCLTSNVCASGLTWDKSNNICS